MTDERYCYPPDYKVLKNKLNTRDANTLERFEQESVSQRFTEGVPLGSSDLPHLQNIHRHLFQDVYDWAGQIRQVEISKGGSQFQPRRFIETGMQDVHRRLQNDKFLQDRSPEAFAKGAGEIIGDINHIHPFREGNGRTQNAYLKLLAHQAGHNLNLARLQRDSWIEASKRANRGDFSLMQDCIAQALDREHGRTERDKIEALRAKAKKARPRPPMGRKRDTDRER